MSIHFSIIPLLFLFTALILHGRELHPDNPVELGLVTWIRDYDEALAQSKKQQKPLFILFQEVPGCANCTRFGTEVLSSPIIKDIIEEAFVPVCIYSNVKGRDAEILRKYGEPSWNNPVVRIVDHQEKDITPRMGRFHPLEIYRGIADALDKTNKKWPIYFKLGYEHTLAEYSNTKETAIFSMFCFWTGELKLGPVEGVIGTTSGFMDSREVVKVEYNAAVLSYDTLLKKAKSVECADKAYTLDASQRQRATMILGKNRVKEAQIFRPDAEVKYYLSKTVYKHLPMLPKQKIMVNYAIAHGEDPKAYLSPSQIVLYNKIATGKKKRKDLTTSNDFVGDWLNLAGG